MTLIARPDFPAKDVNEFVAYVKANKAKINLANAGIGSASHLCGLLFQSAIQTEVTTVPFKGTADALNALIGKQVDFLCDQSTNTTQHINAGTVKAFGVTSKARLPTLPNLPTLDEAGLKGFQVGVWNGVYAPKGTPKAVIDKLAAAVQQAMKEPDFRKRMADLGSTVFAPGAEHAGGAGRAAEVGNRALGPGDQGRRRLRRLIVRSDGPGPRLAAMRAAALARPDRRRPDRYFAAPPCDFTTVSADAIRLETSARLAGTMSVLPVFARLPNAST